MQIENHQSQPTSIFICRTELVIALMCDDIKLAKITSKPCSDNAKCNLYFKTFDTMQQCNANLYLLQMQQVTENITGIN